MRSWPLRSRRHGRIDGSCGLARRSAAFPQGRVDLQFGLLCNTTQTIIELDLHRVAGNRPVALSYLRRTDDSLLEEYRVAQHAVVVAGQAVKVGGKNGV